MRIIRELQGFSQNRLAQLTGIPQATISAIENDRVSLGVERAKVLARALKCHPAVLVFPGWDTAGRSSALPYAAADTLKRAAERNVRCQERRVRENE